MGNYCHPLAVLNTSIATEDGAYTLRTVTVQEAVTEIRSHARHGQGVLSAVGHDATAQALTEILGIEIPVNRIPFAQQAGQMALVFKLRGRPAEGIILDRAQVEAIGYDLKILERCE